MWFIKPESDKIMNNLMCVKRVWYFLSLLFVLVNIYWFNDLTNSLSIWKIVLEMSLSWWNQRYALSEETRISFFSIFSSGFSDCTCKTLTVNNGPFWYNKACQRTMSFLDFGFVWEILKKHPTFSLHATASKVVLNIDRRSDLSQVTVPWEQ